MTTYTRDRSIADLLSEADDLAAEIGGISSLSIYTAGAGEVTLHLVDYTRATGVAARLGLTWTPWRNGLPGGGGTFKGVVRGVPVTLHGDGPTTSDAEARS